jgi:hypothetical protein
MRHVIRAFVVSTLSFASLASAQDPTATAQAPERNSPDVRIDPLQPDFNLSALPTTLRMPGGKWAFRVTHRFNRNLGQGDFGDLAADLFGLDGGGQIGLEVRIGLRDGTQLGIHRTSDRAIQLFGQHNLFDQRGGDRFGLDVVATFEGDDNLSENHKSALGVVVSKAVANRATVYVEPLAVINANPFETGDDHTMMLGLGARVRMTRSMYLVGEYTPRLAGYDPGADQITFGIESRTGGHLFQINVGNGLGTTFGHLAGGGVDYDQWFLGFNISRKFF